MQVLNVEGFEKRVLYNAAKLYSTQLEKAQEYTSLTPIIALTITDFKMFREFQHVISYWKLREKERLITYSDDIELIFVELPKFTKSEDDLATMRDKWIYFIKHAGELDFIPRSFTEAHLVDAFEMANTAGLSEEELEAQFKRRDFILLQKGSLEKAKQDGRAEGLQEGMKKGGEEGITAEKISIAHKSLQQGLDVPLIASITGLSLQEIDQLKKGER